MEEAVTVPDPLLVKIMLVPRLERVRVEVEVMVPPTKRLEEM